MKMTELLPLYYSFVTKQQFIGNVVSLQIFILFTRFLINNQ
jgi:hypothetical protein